MTPGAAPSVANSREVFLRGERPRCRSRPNLTSASRVGVAGAGPTGSFFAIELMRRARRRRYGVAAPVQGHGHHDRRPDRGRRGGRDAGARDSVALEAYATRMRALTEDHGHGRLLRRLCRTGMEFGMVDWLVELAKTNRDLHALLYDVISGQRSYRQITHDFLRLALLWRLGGVAIRRVLRPVG